MGSGKRKRTSSPTQDPDSASESGSKRHSKRSKSTGTPTDDGHESDDRKLDIVFELVGSDKKYRYHADSRPFERVVSKAARRLGVSFLGLRMFHVRAGDLQVPLWDDYDFDALKNRATKSKSKREVIRVYPPGRDAVGSASAPVTAASTPVVSQRATSVPAVLSTPRSALRAPGSTPRSEKRVMYALPIDSPPSTPSPAPGTPTPETSTDHADSKSKRRRKSKRSSFDNADDVGDHNAEPTHDSSPTTPAADLSQQPDSSEARRLVVKQTVASMFKPARPSPLSQATVAESSDEELPAKKRKAKQKNASPVKEPAAVKKSPAKQPSTPASSATQNGKSPVKKAEPKQTKKERRRSRNSDLPPVYGDIPPVVGSVAAEGTTDTTANASATPSSTPPAPTSSLPSMSLQTPEGRKRALAQAREKAAAKSVQAEEPAAAMRQTSNDTDASATSTSADESATSAETSQKKRSRRKWKSDEAAAESATSEKGGSDAQAEASSEPPKKKQTAAQRKKEEARLKKEAQQEAKAKAAKLKEEEAKAKKEAQQEAARIRKEKMEAARQQRQDAAAARIPASHGQNGSAASNEASSAEKNVEAAIEATVADDEEAATSSTDSAASEETPAQKNGSSSERRSSMPSKIFPERGDNETPCALCNVITDHRFVDCPATKDTTGETLAKRLAERKAELARWRLAAKANGGNPADFSEKHDEPLRAINQWLQKVRKVGASVINGEPSVGKPFTPLLPDEVVEVESDAGRATPEIFTVETTSETPVAEPVPVNGATVDVAMDIDIVEADDTPEPPAPAKSVVGNAMGKVNPPATPVRDSSADSSASSSSASSTPDAAEGGTPFLPQMLQRKAALTRRPGSRLSVSDAVIETGDSDSDSDNSDSGSEADSDDSASSSDSDSESTSSSSDVDPDELWRNVMNKPLTKQQQHRARLSLASMHPTQELSDPESLASEDEKEDSAPQRSQRAGSESSIGEFEEDNHSPAPSDVEDSDEDEKRQALLSQVADRTMEVEEREDGESDSDNEKSGLISNRSFTRLAERAGSSPPLDDLPGDRALQEVIDEDDGMEFTQEPAKSTEEFSATQTIEIESVPEPEPTPAKRRGRPPKAATQSAVEDETLPAPSLSQKEAEPAAAEPEVASESGSGSSQPTRRSARAAARAKEPPASQPTTRGGRVTRASARVVSSSQPTRRVTRSTSREPEPVVPFTSQAPTSQDIAEEPAVEAEPQATEEVTPRSARKKPITYSRSSARKSTSKATDSDSEPEANTEKVDATSEALIEPTPAQPVPSSLPPSSFPKANGSSQPQQSSQANGKTQSSPSRQNGEDHPLFLSQPTQLPQTQAYNPHPEPLVPETQAPDSGPARPSSPPPQSSPSPSPRTSPQPNGLNGRPNGPTNSDSGSEAGDAAYNQPISLSLSQRNPAPPMLSSFPTLAQLPKDLLRQGRDAGAGFINRLTRTSTAGVIPAATQQHDDSSEDEDEDDDSSEDEVPEERRERYAGRKKRPSTIGQTIGW